MGKEDLTRIIDSVFLPAGFKRDGNWWSLENEFLIKKVNLQKSNLGDRYYINYGYVLKSLPLGDLTLHVYNGLTKGIDYADLLDQGTGNIDLHNAEINLTSMLNEEILNQFNSVETEQDLLATFTDRQTMNDIPLVVKKHFNLPLS